jgi:hypothetical protein
MPSGVEYAIEVNETMPRGLRQSQPWFLCAPMNPVDKLTFVIGFCLKSTSSPRPLPTILQRFLDLRERRVA